MGTGYLLHFSDLSWKWKALAFALTGTSLALQLMPRHVPFIIPLIIQVAVCIWIVIYWKLDE